MSSSDRIIVLGASAGGVETLKEVLCELPADFPAALFVVLHIPPYQPSQLPKILSDCGRLKAVHPSDGDGIKTGHIYVAPPDHHLLIDHGRIAITKGPKENRFRPSIDALFRSAAHSFGSRAVGVILSGALDDGTSGLWSIKRVGGTAVVQQPSDARFESMPKSALEYGDADYTLSAGEIGALLPRLVSNNAAEPTAVDEELNSRMEKEIDIAQEGNAFRKGFMKFGELSPFTCPECHGALVRLVEGRMSRFRCHTGHGYTDNALLEGIMETTGEQLWQVMRSLEEAVMLLHEMGCNLDKAGDAGRAKVFFDKGQDLEKRSRKFHDLVLGHESLSGDNLGQLQQGSAS